MPGRADVPASKVRQGYRYEPDKFAVACLSQQKSDLVRAPRVAECPVQLECRVVADHPFAGDSVQATAFQVEVLRAHVEEELVIPGTSYVDPMRWDPLMMKFCEFFGGGSNVHPSQLAEGWNMPHKLQPTSY